MRRATGGFAVRHLCGSDLSLPRSANCQRRATLYASGQLGVRVVIELLTPKEMGETDRLAIARGPFSGVELMRNAGQAVAAVILQRFPMAPTVHVLCGPGNNGGDGFVVARILSDAGALVSVWSEGEPRTGTDAAMARNEYMGEARALGGFACTAGDLIVDAIFGAGLTREVPPIVTRAIRTAREAGAHCLAIDLPSGVSGGSGKILGDAFDAHVTVTFVRKKPGHLLLPGKLRCGEMIVADIGISDQVIAEIGTRCFENIPSLWLEKYPSPAIDAYKYSRGHVAVFSGGSSATGAARMAAMAAARIGAGAVTMLSPASAMQVNASHLTSIMLRKVDALEDISDFLSERKPPALVFGPGLGPHPKVGRFLIDLMPVAAEYAAAIVIDADGLTSSARQIDDFLAAATAAGAPRLVLTPHEGEFARLFPDICADAALSKLDKARAAAKRTHAVIVYKGPDTVIAAPDGCAAINANGTPWLATAGSGDVLSGLVAGLIGQGMPTFQAACAAVWIHAEAARLFGPGLIAEDLPLSILPVVRELLGENGRPGVAL